MDGVFSLSAATLRGDLVGELTATTRLPAQVALGQADLLTQGTGPRAQSMLLEAASGLRVEVVGGAVELRCLVGGDKPAWQTLMRMHRPPAELFQAQVALVDAELPLRESRAGEVLAQAGNAFGFFLGAVAVPWNRKPRSLEFIDIALGLMQMLQQRAKQLLACARPHTLQPALMPIVEVPEHGSLPSGHAGESRLVAELLSQWLAGDDRNAPQARMLDRLATRIAHNRVVAGVHFPVDSVAGDLLGRCLFAYLKAAFELRPAPFAVFGATDSKDWGAHDRLTPASSGELATLKTASFTPDRLKDLSELWKLACAEWS